MNVQQVLDRAVDLHRKGALREAEALYLQLLQEAPPHPRLLQLIGILCNQTGRGREALNYFDKALALQPDYVDALCQRADVLQASGRPMEALRDYDKAVKLQTGQAEIWYNRGTVHLALERFHNAIRDFERALALEPEYIDAYSNRGVARLELKQFEAALGDFDRVVRAVPGDADAHYNRGRALAELYQFDEALASMDRALALKPEHVGAMGSRGAVLWNMDRCEEALAAYDETLAAAPGLAVIASNRANTLCEMGRPEEALAGHDVAVAMAPERPSGYWNKSHCLLSLGRFEEGFELFEWRKKLDTWVSFPFRKPEWLGRENIAGKNLFIQAEQGLGDTLQFCRYAFAAQALGANVVLGVQDTLLRLMKGLTPAVETRSWTDPPRFIDYHVPLMSMPLALSTQPDTIPAPVPYLAAEPDKIAYWATRLGREGFRIGVCWRGAGRGLLDVGRSFQLRRLEQLAAIPGVRLISLQKNAGIEELARLPPGMRVEELGQDFDTGADAFVDSAAVMQSLDLVISSDTAIAHLAGALGRPVWLAAKHVPDWRWLLGRQDSPWYPTMRIFRQDKPGDWASVFTKMQMALAARQR